MCVPAIESVEYESELGASGGGGNVCSVREDADSPVTALATCSVRLSEMK